MDSTKRDRIHPLTHCDYEERHHHEWYQDYSDHRETDERTNVADGRLSSPLRVVVVATVDTDENSPTACQRVAWSENVQRWHC